MMIAIPCICLALGAIQSGGELTSHFRIDGGPSDIALGAVMEATGDLNGDGFADFYLGHATTSAVRLYSGADQTVLQTYTEPTGVSASSFGLSIASLADVDGDGIADVAIGASTHYDPGSSQSVGRVFLYSGANGTLLQTLEDGDIDGFGKTVASAGDVNGDGADDFLVGGRHFNCPVAVISGATGQRLFLLHGNGYTDGFGLSLSGLGDLDHDGRDDFIIGAYYTAGLTGSGVGKATVYSGRTGSLLFEFAGEDTLDYFGFSLAAAGDLNRDGTPDILIGAPYDETDTSEMSVGCVHAYSGADGSRLLTVAGDVRWDKFGLSVDGAGDADGDGIPDILVGMDAAASPTPVSSDTFLYSGGTGLLLRRVEGVADPFARPNQVAFLGDLNHDGRDEFLVGMPDANPGHQSYDLGAVQAYSFDPYMIGTSTRISASIGGLIGLTLDFPDAAAGYQYKVLFSASGTGPFHYGIDIPLGLDPLVLSSYYGNYPPALHNGLQGTLDAQGDAFADFALFPPTAAAVIGNTYTYSAIASPGAALPEYSSAPMAVTIDP